MRIRIALTTALAAMSMLASVSFNPTAAQAAVTQQASVPGNQAGSSAFIFSIFPVPGSARAPFLAIGSDTPGNSKLAGLLVSSPQAPAPAPPPPTDATSTDTADWQCIRIEESGDTYNSPTKPSGAYGILDSTWLSNGFYGWPYQAAPVLQDDLALKLYNEFGWAPWSSRYACGL